jgi:hypothetical protein
MADTVAATVAELFCAELGLSACELDDSFFQLGGDSLLAGRVLTRLSDLYAVRIPFAGMYSDGTPRAIARVIEELRAAPRASRRSVASLARRRRRTWFPLALSQEALYAMDAATHGAGLFNNVGILRFSGDIDPDALRAAVVETVRRQSALRLMFGEDGGVPVQRFTEAPPEIVSCDLRGESAGALARRVRREQLRGFDLRATPPARFTVARVEDNAWVLLTTIHHIVFDGMSQNLLMEDLAHAYECITAGGTPRSPLSWDYADFAEWQRDTLRGDRLEAHLDAVQAALARTPAPRLARDVTSSKSFLGRARPFAIGPESTLGLRQLAASCDSTLFVVLAAAMLDFIALRTGDQRPAIAIQASNRLVEGTEMMVGCFANSVHVTVEHHSSLDPADHVLQVRKAVSEALLHQEMPIEVALRLLGERGMGAPGPEYLPQVGFTLQPARAEHRNIPGGVIDAVFVTQEGDAVDPTSFSLVLELFSENNALAGVTHHPVAEWSDVGFARAEAEMSAAFTRFGSTGAPSAGKQKVPN